MDVTTLARRLGATVMVVGLGLGATACSDDSSGTDTSSTDTTSSDASPDASSEASPDASSEGSADAGSEEQAEAPEELSADEFFPTVMTALQDAESFRFNVTTTTAGVAQEVTGVGRFTDAGAELRASSTGAQAVEMIIVDEILYLRSEQMGLGDKWMKIDLRDQQNPLYELIARATDPQSMMKALESPKELVLVGPDEVGGVAANRYRITVDSQQYAEAMGLPAAMGSFLPDEIVQELWVDAENRPLKHSSTLETPGTGGGKPTTATTEGFYSDFGLDVEIEAPPASETTDAPALPGAA